MKLQFSLFLASCIATANGGGSCPFLDKQRGESSDGSFDAAYHLQDLQRRRNLNVNPRVGDGGVPAGGYAAVREEIAKVLTDSQDFFPADFEPPIGPNYGGLMIRLAWHCSGSYRQSDGRGGCDGGRIRFAPELTWDDNANLEMARRLLEPVKAMFGASLSWSDLIVLAGNTAIETLGGPILGFCGGRIDDASGADSLILGPSDIQESLSPCISVGEQGQCMSPLGPTTIGLIYVNPAGPVGFTGDPFASGLDVRKAFSRMGFNDRESVSLIGGGHSFGKCHGACAEPPCGAGTPLEGIGPNTFTSGFEGQWTTLPTTWTNQYFQNLFNYTWQQNFSPAGALQWFPVDGPDIIMLTADIALSMDPAYLPIAEEYAENITSLEEDFAASWYRLTTNDMGSPARCLGPEVPEPQFWQEDLPAFTENIPDFVPIRTNIQALIDGNTTLIDAFAKLARGCASTFRETDYRGGCNGARIRFEPEISWAGNAGAADTLAVLETVKTDDITFADLIVLAGNTAIEAAGGNTMPFCGARSDAENGDLSSGFEPTVYPRAEDNLLLLQDTCFKLGLTNMECAASFAIPTNGVLSNQYFANLQLDNGAFSVLEQSLLVGDFAPIVTQFIDDNELFLTTFARAWTRMMTSDRYDGPRNNWCTGVSHVTTVLQTPAPTPTPPPADVGVTPTAVFGDPHFKTWSGEMYDFHAECDLIFIKAPKFDMDIHIRTTIRKQFSYVSSAAIRIGSETLEIQERGKGYLNNEHFEWNQAGQSIGGYPITHTRPDAMHHIFEIDLGDERGRIMIKTYTVFVFVFVDSKSKDVFEGSRGLNGDYDTGKRLVRDGTEISSDANAFGEAWQVLDTDPVLFKTTRAPQHPQRCIFPEAAVEEGRRRLSEQDVELIAAAHDVCLHFGEDSEEFDACVFDIIATGDVGMADAGVY